MHDEHLVFQNRRQREPAVDLHHLLVDLAPHVDPVLLDALLVEAAAVRVEVDRLILVVASVHVHHFRIQNHETENAHENFQGVEAAIGDVAVEEVAVRRGREPVLVEDPQHVLQLAVRVADDDHASRLVHLLLVEHALELRRKVREEVRRVQEAGDGTG